MNPMSPYRHQQGFTLIELMISLVLGLIISAAVMQVYLINAKTSSIQASASEMQDASVFGIQQLERKLRLANLGNPTTQIDDKTVGGGIVLSAANVGTTPDKFSNGYLTRRDGDTKAGTNGWDGASNMTTNSDQLTIQYKNTTGAVISDCEGSNVQVNDQVVERYFIRMATGSKTTGIRDLVLACDAGRIEPAGGIKEYDSDSDPRNFGQAGQELIVNADQFKVLLGTQVTKGANTGAVTYMPSNAYLALSAPKPAIVAVKVGLIVHGTTAVVGSTDQTKFTLLNQNNDLKTDTTRRSQVRNSYESTVLLRNARVVNVSTDLY